jgi:uncharacterized protein (TIGR03437 family)
MSKRIALLLFMAVAAFGLHGQTIDDYIAVCPSAQEISAIDKDLALIFEGPDPSAAGGFVCHAADGSKDLTRLQERVYQALRVFKAIKFDTPLPWTEKPVYDWLISSVKGIRINATNNINNCCGEDRIINIGLVSGTVWKDATFLRWDGPGGGIYDLQATIVHEARHANGNFPHACSGGDETIGLLGSYAVQLYWWEWLAEHTNSWFAPLSIYDPLLYKRVAEEYVRTHRDQSFCSPGDGVAVVPSNRDFGDRNTAIGTATERIVTVTQTSATPVVVSRVSIEGNDADDFKIAEDRCSDKTLKAEGWFTNFSSFISCIVTVNFSPRSAGVKTAKLVVFDSAANSPHSVSLTGTGVEHLLTIDAVVDGASFLSGKMSPRQYLTLFGHDLTDGSTSWDDQTKVEFKMAGASVKICGIPSRMFYASPDQINIITPSALTVGTQCDVVATSPYGTGSFVTTVPVVAQNLSLFMFIPMRRSTGGIFLIPIPIILNAEGQLLGPPIGDLRPTLYQANRGEVVTGLGTGCGVRWPDEKNTPVTGVPMEVMPKITVGGIPAKVEWAGLLPNFGALCQFNFQVPPNLPPGNSEVPFPLVLEEGGETYSLYVK